MNDPQPGPSRLEQLGYSQQLNRRLGVWEVVALAMADVSPTMAVLFLSGGVFVVGGTFAIGANLILSVVVLLIALCLAELASMFPIAGGMYSLVKHTLPAPVTWITMFNYLIQGIVIPASIALGINEFIVQMAPGFNVSSTTVAIAFLAVATAIALTTVEIGAYVTLVMVIIELAVLGIVTAAAIMNPYHSLAEVTLHPTMPSSGVTGGEFMVVGFGVMLATLAPAFNVINGYDAVLGFSEELRGGERAVAKAVVIAAALACLLIVIPLTAAVIAAPDLDKFFSAPSPVIYSVEQSLGGSAKYIVGIGAAVALFNAMLSLLMYFGRGVYTTGRDKVWPTRVNAVLGGLNRFHAPAAGVLALAIPAGVLIYTSALDFLIIFAGTVIASVYFCIGVAAVVSRVTQQGERRPYKMPFWPLPPIIVVGFTGLALATQERQYLLAEVALIAIALLCWIASHWWNSDEIEGPVVTSSKVADQDPGA